MLRKVCNGQIHFNIKKILSILLGNLSIAFAISSLVLSNGIIAGGVSGIGASLNYYLNFPLSGTVAIINTILFFLGLLFLGKQFALTTLISSAVFPLFLEFFSKLPMLENLLNDLLLSSVIAGYLIGFGVGTIINAGASTGGIDILALLFNKWFHIPIHVAMRALDLSILGTQFFYRDSQQVIYGIVTVLLTSFFMNATLVKGKQSIQVSIVSDFSEELRSQILYRLDAGVTLVCGEKGVGKSNTKMIVTIIPHRKFPELKQLIQKVDPNAFVVSCEVGEVSGRGFTYEVRPS